MSLANGEASIAASDTMAVNETHQIIHCDRNVASGIHSPSNSPPESDGLSPKIVSELCGRDKTMPIAMSCRFPGASNPEKLWDMLAEGRSAWSAIPEDRFKQSSFYHPSMSISGTVSIRFIWSWLWKFIDKD